MSLFTYHSIVIIPVGIGNFPNGTFRVSLAFGVNPGFCAVFLDPVNRKLRLSIGLCNGNDTGIHLHLHIGGSNVDRKNVKGQFRSLFKVIDTLYINGSKAYIMVFSIINGIICACGQSSSVTGNRNLGQNRLPSILVLISPFQGNINAAA